MGYRELTSEMKTLSAALALIGLLVTTLPVRAGDGLTRQQNWALLYASVVGTGYYADDLPQVYDLRGTLAAVLAQESSLCHHKQGLDKASYGCGQIRKPTALLVYGKPVPVKKLQHDDALNIRLAARYLVYCMQQMPSWERSVICYNKGPYRARTMSDAEVRADAYLTSVRRRMQQNQDLLADLY